MIRKNPNRTDKRKIFLEYGELFPVECKRATEESMTYKI